MFNGKNSIALSGWKCDLLFIEKLKDLISKYEGKELAKQRMKVTPNDSTSIGKATPKESFDSLGKATSQVAKKIGLSEKELAKHRHGVKLASNDANYHETKAASQVAKKIGLSEKTFERAKITETLRVKWR